MGSHPRTTSECDGITVLSGVYQEPMLFIPVGFDAQSESSSRESRRCGTSSEHHP